MARLKYSTLDRSHSLEKAAVLRKVERKVKRMTSNMGNGLVTMVMGALLGGLKEWVRDCPSWRKSIDVTRS